MAAPPPPARKQTRLVFAAADDDAPGEELGGRRLTASPNPSTAAAPRPRRAVRSDVFWADLLRGRVHSSCRSGGAVPPVYDDDSGDDGGPKVAFVAPR